MREEINMFYTPKSMDELAMMIEQLNQDERRIAYLYAMMMYNLLVAEAKEKETV